ncbi:MAG: hypothetical protein JXR37_30220 [Kiritimatiellae bacterium]|nr:hypothetical protein [Kiritimatiellia bacterium]
MTPKENALEIMRFGCPERIVGGPPSADCSYFGVNHQPFSGEGGHHSPVGTRWHDIWGIGWQKALEGVMGMAREHPLSDLRKVDSFSFPDPDDPRICAQIYEKAEQADREGKFLTGSHRETLWERSYNLVGMDNLMIGFMDEPNAVKAVFHAVMDFQLGIARHYLAVGLEFAGLGDDLGSQRGLLFSREILEEFLVPEYRRLFDLYKRNGIWIGFHSCGHIEPILDVFMDLGVNVLNPIQASANDLDVVRARTRGRMAIAGGVSTHTIMQGPLEAIQEETRQRLWQLGRDGGYFCRPDQGMPFPEPHIAAFNRTVAEHGFYPLRRPAAA